jgi:chromosomal replication initiation ATPase DnaA
MNIQVKLKECTTAAEVMENRKVVLGRIRAWKPKPRLVEIVEQVEAETAIPVQYIEPEPVPVEIVEEPKYPSIAQIMDVVCRRYGVTKLELCSARKNFKIIRPRFIAIALARELTPFSLPAIGQKFGGRDHSTVLNAINKLEAMRAADPVLDAEVRGFKAQLGA